VAAVAKLHGLRLTSEDANPGCRVTLAGCLIPPPFRRASL
jgi:hypothetical protein